MYKLAIVFSGQGSQYVNMGMDYIDHDQAYKRMADQASEILGFDVIDHFKSDESMKKTLYTQTLMVLKTIFGFEELKKLSPKISAISGFSLGEYSAYYAASVFDFNQIMNIVSKRAFYMDQETKHKKGLMAAIIGLDKKIIHDVCITLQHQGIIDIANENEPKQYVISGEEALVVKASEMLKEKGARRAIVLQTSGAFHTSLMNNASKKLVEDIKNDDILKPNKSKFKIYMNLDAKPLEDKDIFNHIENQMTHPVLFIDTILNMKTDGITHILEIGPGKVLTNLIRKIDSTIETLSFDGLESFDTVKGWLETYGFTK
ncbi:MAG: ACP S-malonyltransferase [Acholeplasmataceae bacterium]